MSLYEIGKEAHDNAVEHGWWTEERNIGEILALIHSEVSEALEEYRQDKMNLYWNSTKPEGFGVELADVIIRVCDLAYAKGIDLDTLVILKMAYNSTRPYRHGGLKA